MTDTKRAVGVQAWMVLDSPCFEITASGVPKTGALVVTAKTFLDNHGVEPHEVASLYISGDHQFSLCQFSSELRLVLGDVECSPFTCDVAASLTSALSDAESGLLDRKLGLLVDISSGCIQFMVVGHSSIFNIEEKTRACVPGGDIEQCFTWLAEKTQHRKGIQITPDMVNYIVTQEELRREVSLAFPAAEVVTGPSGWVALAGLVAHRGSELENKLALLYSCGREKPATLREINFPNAQADVRFSLAAMQSGLQQCHALAHTRILSAAASAGTTDQAVSEEDDFGMGAGVDISSREARVSGDGAVSRIPRSETQVWASGRPNVSVVITGVSAALPGRDGAVFTPGLDNIQRIINGETFIAPIPDSVKDAMLEKNVVVQRRNKDGTTASVPIAMRDDTIGVCASLGSIDLSIYGVSESIANTMDRAVQVSVAAGLEALKSAGLVSGILNIEAGKTGWELPEHMQSSTGVVYATSFPALDTAIAEVSQYFLSKSLDRAHISSVVAELRNRLVRSSHNPTGEELSAETESALKLLEQTALEAARSDPNSAAPPYAFDRKFLFRVLVLGNAQLAQIIKARGPNMQTNAACAGATQAIALAYDLIQVGRAERVVVIAGDNASSDNLMPWLGNGFRILGAATTCKEVKDAAQPFSAGRSGMILGSGGIGMVLESEAGALRRHALATRQHMQHRSSLPAPAARPFRCRLLGTLLSNSAYHGAAMDRAHIAEEMERFISAVETEHGLHRAEIARHGVYFSHETGTHASPSSSCAANEIYGLRKVFGEHLSELLILNTKGFTGHPMGVSFEDVVAVEVLCSGRVPPIANFNAVDPNLGEGLRMSRGGDYPCRYAIRFAAGFGSQIALALYGIA